MSEGNELPTAIGQLLLLHSASGPSGATDYINSLIRAESDLIRVNIVSEDLKKHNLLAELVQDKKDDDLAIAHRGNGNWFFQIGDYTESMKMYTRSLVAAETPELIALAYANRSASLLYLGRYAECLVDIERAIENNYPKELRYKVIRRRRQAQKALKPQAKYHDEVPEIPESEKNSLIQCASNCIKIKCNEEYGRHVVATRDIQIGEFIVVEKPFVYGVKKEQLFHCHHCLELCYNPIPCNSCTQALFCGEACKDQAQVYHKYECFILLHLVKKEIDFMKVIIRAAILAKPEYEQLETYRFDRNEFYRSDRYKEIHCLRRKPRDADREVLFMSALTAMTVHRFETTDFFENDYVKDRFKEIVAALLQIHPINIMGISEYTRDADSKAYMDFSSFATALYSFSSLFNHSCCPNTFRCFYGSTVVFWTINTIKKGEQCFSSYGSHYFNETKPDRQLALSQKYLFICNCKACEEEWDPTAVTYAEMMNLPKDSKKLRIHMTQRYDADIEFAKKMLPISIEKLKAHESTEPWSQALSLKQFIEHCYKSMGNKREF